MAELDITPNVSGSGADTQVAYWSGPTVLTSSANLITDSSGNLLSAGYLRIGSTTAPTNTTAGDLTAVRLKVGDGAFGTGVEASITGDGALSGFLRVGSETAPANTTAGDITGGRLSLGNSAFATGNVADIRGTSTNTASGAVIFTNWLHTISPTTNSSS